jgi:electron transfer flavoprotein beta subunit
VITELAELEVSENGIVAVRPAGGRKERFESSFPVVITADKGLNDPRYPKLPDIMKAKRKPLHTDKTVSVSASGLVTQIKAEFPPEKSGGKKIEGTPDEVVSELVEGLSKQEKVI